MKNVILNIIIASIVGVAVFYYLYISETSEYPVLSKSMDIFLWNLIAVNSIGFVLPYLSSKLNAMLSWKLAFGKRYFSGFFLYLIVGYTIIVLFGLAYLFFPQHDFTLKQLVSGDVDFLYKLLIISGFLIFLYTLIDLALFSYRQYAVEQIQSIRQTSERLNLQLAALKNQLSPHFLFNSLNTASSLIYRNTETAERFIRKLADSYNKILDSVYYDLIPLSKELEIINTYKYLMEIRYEQALEIDVNIPAYLLQSAIPPLSLQLLVENAVKHNLINVDKPLSVKIYSDQNEYITVENNLNDKSYYISINNELIENPEMRSSGIGLTNIKNRFAFFTSKPVKIGKHNSFIVQLPILQDAPIHNKSVFNLGGSQKSFSQ